MARLEFSGARYVRNYHLAVPHHELEIDKKKSFRLAGSGNRVPGSGKNAEPGLDDNLIIHGDNLKALKSLLPHFAGKVKCIYIDPPYNTGNENWVYNDNVNSPRHKEWLNKVVDKDCQDRHDRWLSMMMPRLKLLRELLRDDGVIFISIDDNEINNIISLMLDIFGEDNFRNIIMIRRGVKSVQAQFETVDRLSYGCEYVICFTKSSSFRFPNLHIELDDAKEGGWNNHWRGTDRPSMRYKIFGIKHESGQWRWGEGRSKAAIENYNTMLRETGKTENTITQEEIDGWWTQKAEEGEELDLLRLSDNGKPEHYIAPSNTHLASSNWSDLKPNGSHELKAIFGKKVFETPKSTGLIRRLIEFSNTVGDDLILDSFAGSGTTAHAVLALNKEDGGNRKFILVEQEDYADTTTAERVRRVIKGYGSPSPNPSRKREGNKNSSPLPLAGGAGGGGLGGSFTYVTLGEEISENGMLSGKALPSYETLAEYCFFTATGKPFDSKKLDKKNRYIGSTDEYDVYLFYEADVAKLKSNDTALTFNWVELQPKRDTKKGQKTKLVFAPVRYVGQETLTEYDIEFCQLPWEIYRKLETAA